MKGLYIGLLSLTFLAVLFGSFQIENNFLARLWPSFHNQQASTFFVDSVTEASLKDIYASGGRIAPRRTKGWFESRTSNNPSGVVNNGGKLKVLIVPGHDRSSPGTSFGSITEEELTAEVGEELYNLLKQDPRLDVSISRTKDGYTPVFASYFENNQKVIADFVNTQKQTMNALIGQGKVQTVVNVYHNDAPNDVAMRLYGINKWSNENGVDIAIHIHFNDYPGRPRKGEGKYSGFSIYVPERQFSNAKGSKPLAEAVQKRLSKLYAQSNLPKEYGGVIEDQELIAVGAFNTLDGAAMLIEYGYIYESQFIEPETRSLVMSDLALQTYMGVMDFLGNPAAALSIAGPHETKLLPHTWQSDLAKGAEADRDVLSLQAALAFENVYPPAGKTKNDCGLSGYFGPCTQQAVQAFQEKYGIEPALGVVGEMTKAKLNELYSI